MSQKIDPRLQILLGVATALIIGGIITGVVLSSQGNSNQSGTAQMTVDATSYDFGEIPINGGVVRHTFKITNNGTANLKLSNIKTSCMCTTATLKTADKTSPNFGMHNNPAFWSQDLAPRASAELEVVFDPLAHGPNALGPITRTITMSSDDGSGSGVRTNFTITGNVVR